MMPAPRPSAHALPGSIEGSVAAAAPALGRSVGPVAVSGYRDGAARGDLRLCYVMDFIKGCANRRGRCALIYQQVSENMAEEVGFEPTVELPPRRFSRPLP